MKLQTTGFSESDNNYKLITTYRYVKLFSNVLQQCSLPGQQIGPFNEKLATVAVKLLPY